VDHLIGGQGRENAVRHLPFDRQGRVLRRGEGVGGVGADQSRVRREADALEDDPGLLRLPAARGDLDLLAGALRGEKQFLLVVIGLDFGARPVDHPVDLTDRRGPDLHARHHLLAALVMRWVRHGLVGEPAEFGEEPRRIEVQTVLKSADTGSPGNPRLATQTYQTMEDLYTTDPTTDSGWTAEAVNSAECGYRIV